MAVRSALKSSREGNKPARGPLVYALEREPEISASSAISESATSHGSLLNPHK